jgi:arylsulfatase A-like enzyme
VGRAIRTERWKYSVSAPDKDAWNDAGSDRYVEEFLYDLAADPHELTNLAGLDTFAGLAAELRERLVRRMVQAGEAAPTIEPAPARPGGERGLAPDTYLRKGQVAGKSPHLP